jgi:hypothetical protein
VEGYVAEEGGGERPTRDTGGRGAWSGERTKGLSHAETKGEELGDRVRGSRKFCGTKV